MAAIRTGRKLISNRLATNIVQLYRPPSADSLDAERRKAATSAPVDIEDAGLHLRGAAAELWRSTEPEIIIAGPAETGKTWAACQKLHAFLWRYPNAQAAMVRKTQASLYGTVVQTYRRVLGPDSLVKAYGGSKPLWFDYPNGSRLWLGGLDNPTRVLSSERDMIYVNQAEELALEDWEYLRTRNTGRGSVTPYAQQIGDCNPGPPNHWIKLREKTGDLRLVESRHEDNPTLFTEDGQLTDQGVKTLAILDSLTGVRYYRLRLGRWVSAEGIVYEDWNAAVHLVDRFEIPAEWPRSWVVDFGFTNPFVWQAWAEDPDSRLWMYREIYHTHRLVEDHAADILAVSGWKIDNDQLVPARENPDPLPAAIYCDTDAEDRATLAKHLKLTTTAAHKTVSDGIQAVSSRLRPAGDGKPRLFLFRDALVERDEELANKRKPTCTAEEFEVYVWDTRQGLKKGDQPVKENDHGMDGLRYRVAASDLAPSITWESR